MASVRRHRARALAGLLIAALAAPGVSLAGPEGENVVSGSAEFERAGDLTVITTHTGRTTIQYTGFDIAPQEAVRIDQPDATSITLNEVLSTDPTRINGLLSSNGQVWIVNPVGVFFGDQAIVDVGGLVAAAGHVAEEDFLAGVQHFTDLSGPVEVASGAELSAAQSVLLVGATVANYGHIAVEDGMIALVAGGEVQLARVGGRVLITADRAIEPDPERYAVEQAGTLDAGRGRVSLTAGDAYSLAMNHTGVTRAREIEVAGGDGLVRVDGTLDASGDTPGESGGRIAVTGDRLWIGAAELDASGDAGGGEILVGGDAHGGGETPTAARTYVSPDAVLRADARTSGGDGGRIIVWADEATRFYGTVSARGGSEGGDGGFAEISGAKSLVSRGAVDLSAEAGEAGTLLYDPLRIVIQGGTADGTDTNDATPPETFLRGDGGTPGSIASGDAGDGGEPFVIYESEIEGTDANLVLQATQSIQTQGTFAANDVAISPGRDVSLSVVDGGQDVPPGEIVGIDVATHDGGGDLLWKLSQGGIFTASTTSSAGRDANIAIGAVETQGVRAGTTSAVNIATVGSGSIDVGSITTSGAPRSGTGQVVVFGNTVDTVAAGNVSVVAQTGDVSVGSVQARGGDATSADPGDGGAGGDVSISTLAGALGVGSVDASGGDGVVQLVDDGAGGLTPSGRGGDAGTIALVSDLDPADPEADLPATRSIGVTGDLLARGGDGLGTASDAGELFGADGGTGGQILLSTGLIAEGGRIDVGSPSTPVRLDASGGDGTGAGGSAGSGGQSAYSGAEIGAIRLEAYDDVTTDADLVATGGDAGFDAALAADAGPGGAGGLGGDVSASSQVGSVALRDSGASFSVVTDGGSGRIDPSAVVDADGVAHFDGTGGAAGGLLVETAAEAGDVEVTGGVSAQGGAGVEGAGGAGGGVTLTAGDGRITLADVTVDGGSGTGSVDASDGAADPQGVQGGNGGDVSVTTAAADASAASHEVLLAGAISSRGGAGTPDPDGGAPEDNNGVGGTVRITSAGDLDAAGASDTQIRAGTVELTGVNVGSGGGSGDLVLASTQIGSPPDFESSATVQAAGDLSVALADADRFARFELIETDAAGDVAVRRDGGSAIASGTGATGLHTITQLDTDDADPFFTYRLADTGPDPDVVQIDVATLAVASGAVSLGAKGGVIANARADSSQPGGEQLVGRIQGDGAGPHIDAAVGVQVLATNVGDVTPLRVGSAENLQLQVAGDVDMVLDDVTRVDLVQRSAAGDVDMALAGGGTVSIAGTVVDDGATRTEASRVTAVNTTGGGPDFFYHLADDSASSDEPGTGEPLLTIASGAVDLGGAGGFATTGDLILEDGAQPAIEANGNTVLLIADSNLDGAGAIVGSGSGAPDVAGAGALVAYSGSGVGSEDVPLRTSAASGGTMSLSGNGGSGEFRLANLDGDVAIDRIRLQVASEGETVDVSYGGVFASGDVVIDNGGRQIALGEIQPEDIDPLWLENAAPSIGLSGPETDTDLIYGFGGLAYPLAFLSAADPALTVAHVASGGSQELGGSVSLDNVRSFETVDPDTGDPVTNTVHQVVLIAGGDATFGDDVDTAPGAALPADLEVNAGGTIHFGGDVGSDLGGAPSIASLALTDAAFDTGSHTITTGVGQFGRLDGPGDLALRGVGPNSELVFGGDVGTGSTLATFDADADRLNFAGADRIVAGSVALNTATPSTTVPDVATIVDTDPGGLSIQSAGDVTTGTNEKVSVAGPLAVQAGGTAALGDLSATELNVQASRIVIQGRDPGPVQLPDGTSVFDRGVDWVANDIVTNVVPEWDGSGTSPTFVLGSGGILTGGVIPFDVIRYDSHLDRIRPTGFYGLGGVLDLVGLGPRVVSDPSKDVPREPAPVDPELQARFSDTQPDLPPAPSEATVLATVRCRTTADTLCPSPVHGDGPLDDERSRDIVERYHALLGTPQGRHQLVAAFEPVARADLFAAGDGAALYRLPAQTPDFDEARDRVDELAVVLAQVSLLGLDDAETDAVRRAVAGDFAAGTGVAGLDAETALEAVAASGVGVLPN